jgi:hypothetical protein
MACGPSGRISEGNPIRSSLPKWARPVIEEVHDAKSKDGKQF